MKRASAVFSFAIICAIGVSDAGAHSFEIGFVAPFSGPESRLGNQALDAFLYATKERDSHEGEESDGHLGGLDLYIFKIDSGGSPESIQRQIGELSRSKGFEFVTGVFTPKITEAVHAALAGTQTVLVDPVDCAAYRASAGSPDRLYTMSGERFSEVFRRTYGYDPGAYAGRGYTAARLIDAVVRPAGDRISETGVLRSAFDDVCATALMEKAQ